MTTSSKVFMEDQHPSTSAAWQCISGSKRRDAGELEASFLSSTPARLTTTENATTSSFRMSDEEIVAGPPGATTTDARTGESRPKYRSWRKKYRKMKARFDDVMKESNSLFVDEQKLDALSKRLQEQNE